MPPARKRRCTVPVISPTLSGTTYTGNAILTWNFQDCVASYIVQRGPSGSGTTAISGSLNKTQLTYTDTTVINGTAYDYRLQATDLRGNTFFSHLVTLTAPVAGTTSDVGYAAVAGTTGGEGGTRFDVQTWVQLRTALLATVRREIFIHGNALLDGGGDSFKVTTGNMTLDGSDWTGQMKNNKMVFSTSNLIFRELANRNGQGASGSASADRRCLTFSPGNDGTVNSKILIDRCSLAWGPDVIGSFLNNITDATISNCIIGPSLETSNNVNENPNGYGFNVTVPGNSDPSRMWGKRMTFYRNFMVLCKQRNIKAEHTEAVDYVNNVVYDWGNSGPIDGNPRSANYVGNYFKKGPQTRSSLIAFEPQDLNSSNGYPQYVNSIYHGNTNVGRLSNGNPFTLDWSQVDGAALSTTAFTGGPTAASHGALSVATANDAMFTSVIASAGRSYHDTLDNLMRTYATNGTDGGNFYQSPGFGSPNPSW